MKPVYPNKPTFNNSLGRILQHELYLNQAVLTNSSPTFNNLQLTGDATINGSLFVYGNTTLLETNLIEFEDNIILLNSKETGNGVFLNKAGIEIERGNLENFQIVYNESNLSLQAGFISNLKNVTTHSNPVNNQFMFWDSTNNQIVSSNNSVIDFTFYSTTESVNLTTASLVVSGGLSILKDTRINKTLILQNATSSSSIYTNNSKNLVFSSPNNISLEPFGNQITIPKNIYLSFNTTSQSISSDNFNNFIIYSGNSINITASSINIPNQVPLTFSTATEKIYTDNSNNMVIESNNSIILKPNISNSVSIPANYSLSFYSLSQRITSNINNDLYIYSGNDLYLSPGINQNIKLPTQTGIILGNTSNNLYTNSSNDLFFNIKNLNISPSLTSSNIILSSSIPLCFNSTSSNIRFTNGNLTFTGTCLFSNSVQFNNTISLVHTTNSISTSSGSLIISGGVGIQKDTNIGGSLTVNGNLNVLGNTTTISSTEYLIGDNIIVLNNGPVGLLDGGLLFKHFVSGTSGSTLFSGVIFKQDSNSIIFTSSTSDSTQITPDYIPIQSSSLTLHSSNTSSNFTTGGALSCLGGASFLKSVLFGDNILVSNNISSNSLQVTFSTLSNSFITNSSHSNLNSSNLISSNSSISNLISSNINSSNSTLSNSIITNSSISSLLCNNATLSNSFISSSTISNLLSSFVSLGNSLTTNSTITNLIVTNISVSNSFTSNSDISFATIGTLLNTNLIGTNASVGTATITNANISNSTISNSFITNSSIGTLNATNSNVTTSTISSLLNTNLIGTNSTLSNSFLTNSNITTSSIGTLVNSNASMGIMYVNNSTGIMLNNADRPMITRGWDTFSSGNYSGAGRWGLFMEGGATTLGIPAGGVFRRHQFVSYNADSTINTTMMTIHENGNVGIGTDAGSVPTHRLSVSGGSVYISGGITASSLLCTGSTITNILCTNSTQSNTIINNSTVNSLLLTNNFSITNTQNSLSVTNGGPLTIYGGTSIVKDVYIGGNLYVSGTIDGYTPGGGGGGGTVTSPGLTFSNFNNCSLSSYSNSKSIESSNEILLSFNVEITPSSDSSNCQFELTLPNVSNNFSSYNDITPSINGFSDITNLIPLFNCLVVSKPSSTNCIIKFHSISTSLHYLSIIIRYTKN